MLRALMILVGLVLPGTASAQVVLPCEGYRASALAIPEPWDAHSRLFANGAVRVTLMDTLEPAAGALFLMIQSPPEDEMGNRSCAIVAMGESGMGYADLFWNEMETGYDPARGIILRMPVTIHAPAAGTGFVAGRLVVTINQATGAITPTIEFL